MSFPFGKQIVVTTRTAAGKDSYGNQAFTETQATVSGAFAPAAGTEALDAQDQVVSQPQAFLPHDTVVDMNTVLTIDGADYEVTGAPEVWVSPFTGKRPGIRVALRRVTG